MILKLGEAGALQILISQQVLSEAERAFRRKAPRALGLLALLLDQSRAEIVPDPLTNLVVESQRLTGHAGDAWVLAAAWTARADYFVTLDREHFLNNETLIQAVPFPIGTPGDCLAWLRDRFAIG